MRYDIRHQSVMKQEYKYSRNFERVRSVGLIITFSVTSLLLSGCDLAPKPKQETPDVSETSPENIPVNRSNRAASTDEGATPMLERVAIIGLLNKRTGKSRTIEMTPDKALRFDNVVVKVQACERTAPWETFQDIGAFTQLFIKERPPGTNQAPIWRKVFSGWLHRNNPSQNVVEHGLYDVWVKDCIMLFPGESTPPVDTMSAPISDVIDIRESNAPQSPAPERSTVRVPEETPAPEEVSEEPVTEIPAEPSAEAEEEVILDSPPEEVEEEFIELDDLVDSAIEPEG